MKGFVVSMFVVMALMVSTAVAMADSDYDVGPYVKVEYDVAASGLTCERTIELIGARTARVYVQDTGEDISLAAWTSRKHVQEGFTHEDVHGTILDYSDVENSGAQSLFVQASAEVVRGNGGLKSAPRAFGFVRVWTLDVDAGYFTANPYHGYGHVTPDFAQGASYQKCLLATQKESSALKKLRNHPNYAHPWTAYSLWQMSQADYHDLRMENILPRSGAAYSTFLENEGY